MFGRRRRLIVDTSRNLNDGGRVNNQFRTITFSWGTEREREREDDKFFFSFCLVITIAFDLAARHLMMMWMNERARMRVHFLRRVHRSWSWPKQRRKRKKARGRWRENNRFSIWQIQVVINGEEALTCFDWESLNTLSQLCWTMPGEMLIDLRLAHLCPMQAKQRNESLTSSKWHHLAKKSSFSLDFAWSSRSSVTVLVARVFSRLLTERVHCFGLSKG